MAFGGISCHATTVQDILVTFFSTFPRRISVTGPGRAEPMGNVILWGRMGEIWRGHSRGVAVGIGSVAFLPEILPSIQASFCWSRAWQEVQPRLNLIGFARVHLHGPGMLLQLPRRTATRCDSWKKKGTGIRPSAHLQFLLQCFRHKVWRARIIDCPDELPAFRQYHGQIVSFCSVSLFLILVLIIKGLFDVD